MIPCHRSLLHALQTRAPRGPVCLRASQADVRTGSGARAGPPACLAQPASLLSIYSVSRGRDCLPPGTGLKCVQLMQYSCIFDRFFSSVLYLLQKVIRSVLLTTTCSEILQFLSGLHFMIDFLLGS